MKVKHIESNYPENYPYGHIIVKATSRDDDNILREFLRGMSKNDLSFNIQNYGCECYDGNTQNYSFMFGFRKLEAYQTIALKISTFIYSKKRKKLFDRIKIFAELLKMCMVDKI